VALNTKDYNPSRATIDRAVLFTYGTPPGGEGVNITSMVTGFSLTQSIAQNSYIGTILIEDRVGLLENAMPRTKEDAEAGGSSARNLSPLRGEERLQLSIKGYDLGTVVNMDVRIYKIDGITPTASLDGKTFAMHFTSTSSFKTIGKRVVKPFYDVFASTAAKRVFEEYFGGLNDGANYSSGKDGEKVPPRSARYDLKSESERHFYLQRTEGVKRLVIPNYNPAQTMNFLARESFSSRSPSCTFRFFETVDGYYFVTDEWLIEFANLNEDKTESGIIDLVFNPYGSNVGTQTESQIQTIEKLSYPSRVDTSADFYSGGYRNNVIEVDINRKRVLNQRFNYEEIGNFLNMNADKKSIIEDDVHSLPFIKDNFDRDSERTFMVVRDYGTQPNASIIVKNEQHFSEIVSNRVAYNHHLNRTPLTLELKGRLDIKPGKVVNITMPDLSALSGTQKHQHEQLSGKYLVKETLHSIEDNILSTRLSVTKFDWST